MNKDYDIMKRDNILRLWVDEVANARITNILIQIINPFLREHIPEITRDCLRLNVKNETSF